MAEVWCLAAVLFCVLWIRAVLRIEVMLWEKVHEIEEKQRQNTADQVQSPR